MALKETRLLIDTTIVGHITPQGRYLDRARFRALRPVERLRAYLGLVAPAARSSHVLARVCGVDARNVANFLNADVARGRVIRVGSPRQRSYAVVRDAWGCERLETTPQCWEGL